MGFKYGVAHLENLLHWLEEKFPKECDGLRVNVVRGVAITEKKGKRLFILREGDDEEAVIFTAYIAFRSSPSIIMILPNDAIEFVSEDKEEMDYYQSFLKMFSYHMQYLENSDITEEDIDKYAADKFVDEQYAQYRMECAK